MVVDILLHFASSSHQLFGIDFLEAVYQLSHLLIVEGFDDSLEALLMGYFCLFLLEFSLEVGEEVDLNILDQINQIERHVQEEYILQADCAVIHDFVVLRLREGQILPLVGKSDRAILEEKEK